ncbi:cohesin domain-containing protein [bacterium]
MRKNILLLTILLLVAELPAYSADVSDEPAPGISLAGELMEEDGKTFLLVSINVNDVSGLNAACVDVEYETEKLELVNVLDDVDIETDGGQNFLGSNILSVHAITELGVSEYAVSKKWNKGVAPAGSEGSGAIGLLVFRMLKSEETTFAIREETLELLKEIDVSIPEYNEDFVIEGLAFDPNAE